MRIQRQHHAALSLSDMLLWSFNCPTSTQGSDPDLLCMPHSFGATAVCETHPDDGFSRDYACFVGFINAKFISAKANTRANAYGSPEAIDSIGDVI